MIDKKLKYYAKKLNEDAPKGEFLAYINKKESNLLKQKGGLGIKTKSGIPSYIGSDASGQGGGSTGGGPGDASDSGSGSGNGNGGDGGDRHNPHTDSGYSPVSVRSTPTTTTPSHSPHTDFDPSPVDRSAVSQFSTFGRNTMNQNLQGPSALSNITGGIKDYVLGGGLIGMGIRGLGSLFGPSVPSTGNVGPAGIKTDGTYGTIGDAINAGGRNEGYNDYGDGDGLGIMTANILPYQLPGEEVPVSQEEEDFIQRFKVKDQFRKAKGIERLIQDKAIAEMISKLYT